MSAALQIRPGFGRTRLQGELVRAGLRLGCEVGVQCGEHAETLLQAGVDFLFLVDLWAQQPDYFDVANVHDAHHQQNYEETLIRMAKYPGRFSVKRGASVALAREFNDGYFDFVYIDANHNLEPVRADLRAWYPKVRPGGWLCGHDFLNNTDYCGTGFAVEAAVREFCAEIGVTELCVCPDEPFPNWHFVKPEADRLEAAHA